MPSLLLLFVVVPALELVLLIELGSRIGTLATFALIVITGVVGATLARRQGLGVLRRLQQDVESGRLPAESLFEGAFVLVAGALLVTPGVLTDVVGFLCLVPAFRRHVRRMLERRFERAVAEGRVRIETTPEDFPWSSRAGGRREEKVVRDLRGAAVHSRRRGQEGTPRPDGEDRSDGEDRPDERGRAEKARGSARADEGGDPEARG
ncbi:MAG: FxsA family protein [bacterium]